jgi:uncharacterized repeat protein (TIGR01451 family)
MRRLLTNEKGVAMVMVVAFLALAIPVVTAALALAGTLSLDSRTKNRIAREQYSNLGIEEYLEHILDDPGDLQDWEDTTGCEETVDLNGEEITLTADCTTPSDPPGDDSPALPNRQFRTFKEVFPETAEPNINTTYTYTIRVYNAAGVDDERTHGHLGHGYWKQPHHFASWVGYTPEGPGADYFDTVFGVGPHVTLLEALREGGGHETAFNRDAVTGLLNASNPSIDFEPTVPDIVGYVEAAYSTGDFDHYKHLVRGQNHEASFTADVDDEDDGDSDDDNQPGVQPIQRIYDGLPPDFTYVSNTSRLNGVPIGDPTVTTKRDLHYVEEVDDDDDGPGNLGPDYWKLDDNYASWTAPMTPSATFSSVFGVGPSNKSLADILNSNGQGVETLMQKEAIAGALNAAHPTINYLYEFYQVVEMVQLAYMPGGSFSHTKNELRTANNAAYYIDPGRPLLVWYLDALDVEVPSGEYIELSFDARANVPEGNYCNEAWVEPGYKDHDEDDHGDGDDDQHDWGRGTGSDMTARVRVGNPVDQFCPGEAVMVTTHLDQNVAPTGTSHQYTYTIEIENVGDTTLHIDRISDILPIGFTYVPGETTGLTNWDPTITVDFPAEGNTHLEWSEPFDGAPPELAPGQTLTLAFKADATLATMGNFANEVWVYFTEYSGSDEAVYTWPTGVIRAMDVFVVTATDSEGNVIGTYEVWVGTDSTIIR